MSLRAPVLLTMEYSRNMETDADNYAIALMHQVGHSTEPLADLFEMMETAAPADNAMPRWMRSGFGYLSSRPSSGERGERFRAGQGPIK